MTEHARDFSTISPSAKALLVVKSQTTIPFAREAADLLWGAQGAAIARAEAETAPVSHFRAKHFENRYWSLDEALRTHAAPRTSVLEIASGLSFRGLAMAAREAVFYLDTDLPEMAAIKADLVARLRPGPLSGTLRVKALDALDAEAFRQATGEIPPGPLAIVNEGLLVYLDAAEKARLAGSIRAALLSRASPVSRAGVWITGDVYVKNLVDRPVVRDERAQRFFEQHRIEERKFDDWEAAERFFTGEGFVVRARLAPDEPRRARETWVLAPKA